MMTGETPGMTRHHAADGVPTVDRGFLVLNDVIRIIIQPRELTMNTTSPIAKTAARIRPPTAIDSQMTGLMFFKSNHSGQHRQAAQRNLTASVCELNFCHRVLCIEGDESETVRWRMRNQSMRFGTNAWNTPPDRIVCARSCS